MPSLLGVLGLDANPFQRGLSKSLTDARRAGNQIASALTSNIGNRLAALGSTAVIGGFAKQTVEWASNLRDSADALSLNVEFLQKLQNGARLAGGDIEDITRMILELNRSRQDAAQNPGGKNAQAFTRLGFSGGDVSSLSTQDFVQKLIAAFKGGATAQLTNDVQEIGGRSAKNLIAAFANQFASDTPILAEDMVDELDDIGDRFTSLATTLKVTLAPVILDAADGIKDFINWLKQLIALIGGIATKVSAKDVFSAILTRDPRRIANLLKKASEGFDLGGQAAVEEEARQKKEQAAIESGQAAMKAARKARENAGPAFENLPLLGGSKPTNLSLNSNQKIGAQAYIPPETAQMLLIAKDIRGDVRKLVNMGANQQQTTPRRTEF